MDWSLGKAPIKYKDGMPPVSPHTVAVRSPSLTAIVYVSHPDVAEDKPGDEALRRVARAVVRVAAASNDAQPARQPFEGSVEIAVAGEPPLYFTPHAGPDQSPTEYLLRYLWQRRAVPTPELKSLARRIR